MNQRNHQLIVVIASISAVGLSLGLTIPLISLTLEHRGVDSTLIGIMAAMPALGILCFSPLMPALVARTGARAALLSATAIGGSTILLLPFIDHYGFWLFLRFIMGAVDAIMFTVSETWINQIAEDHNRGRLVALYITVLSLCFGCGPLLIIVTGSQGFLPFIAACAVFYAAALPLLSVKGKAAELAGNSGFNVLGFMRLAPTLCAAALLFALLDNSAISLLPVFGLRHGYPENIAAFMITVLIIGNITLQFPLGWLADRMDRYRLLFFCGCGTLISAFLLPLTVALWPVLLWPNLVLLGVSSGGLYTLAIILVGQRFRGKELVTANAAIGVIWGIGGLLGPPLGGLAMHWSNPDGLTWLWILMAALFLLMFLFRNQPTKSS